MTYCLGWKSEIEVFLIADTAVTRYGASTGLVTHTSSFGEAHVNGRGRTVEEGCLKLIQLGEVAFCFAGDVISAYSMGATIKVALRDGADPKHALTIAANSHCPFPPGISVYLLLAYFDTAPKLLAFDSDSGSITEEEGIACLGSMEEHLQALTVTLPAFLAAVGAGGEETLVASLSVVQSLGTHHLLLESGVGGAICGLRVGKSGVNWQPDICFAFPAPNKRRIDTVVSMVRDAGLIVYSAFVTQQRNFTNSLVVPDLTVWEQKWASVGSLVCAGRFNYVCFVNIADHIVVVVRMDGETRSRHLRIVPATFGQDRGIRLDIMSPELGKAITTREINLPIQFTWVPYEPPSSDGNG